MLIQHPLHSPDEMRQISNLAHALEGVVLGLAAFLALLQTRDGIADGKSRYSWQALVTGAGLLLLGYLLLPHHGFALARAQWDFVLADPQQRQHVAMSVLLLIGGGSALLLAVGMLRRRAWRLAWPLALFAIGALFVLHEQHGTSDAVARATMIHNTLGGSFILGGLSAGGEAMTFRPHRIWSRLWPAALLVAALLLLVHREPGGAYEDHESGPSGHR
jgi:hypothetical protein